MIKKIPIINGLIAARSGMRFVNDVTAFTKNIMDFASAGVGLFAILGLTSNVCRSSFSFDATELLLPFRFGMALIIACAMGWLFSSIVRRLSLSGSAAGSWLSVIAAGLAACLLVTSATWLSLQSSPLPELHLFTCLGMGAALWIATFQFGGAGTGSAVGVIKTRSQALMTFSITCAGLLALTVIGQS